MLDWKHASVQEVESAFCVSSVLGLLERAGLGDPEFDQLRQLSIFAHRANPQMLLDRQDLPAIDFTYLLLLDLQERFTSRRGLGVLVSERGKTVEMDVINFNLDADGFGIWCVSAAVANRLSFRFRTLDELGAQGVKFENEDLACHLNFALQY